MSAERLREAAKVLREVAGAATPGPWFLDSPGGGDGYLFVGNRADGRIHGLWDIVHMTGDRMGDLKPESRRRNIDDAAYIATMAPPVALALAELLETTGRVIENTGRDWPGAFEGEKSVADAILGGVS